MKTPISDMLEAYRNSGAVRMHMPGHKGKGSIANACDVTELSFTDDLRNPSGVIMQSEKAYADEIGAKFCHYLVNGTTSGLFALVMCASGKILIESNCHCSIRNALAVFGKDFAEIQNPADDSGLPPPVSAEQIRRAADENPDAGTVFVTSPDYFGRTADLKNIYKLCKSRKLKLFVDSAHGAHFGLSKRFPPNACGNCDAAVESVHKTLPALTQAAVLLTDSKDLYADTKSKLNLITTTSPGFLILRSIETAMASVSATAKSVYDALFAETSRFCDNCRRAGWDFLPNDDFTRVVLDCAPKNLNGKKVYAALEKKGVYCEHATDRYVVMILSPSDSGLTLDAVYSALCKIEPDSSFYDGTYIENCFAKN